MTNDTNGPNPSDHDTSSLEGDEKLEQLATRFLALWREQVAATADGEQAASAIGRLYASLGADTTRMGEGFEAWGNLIGQMAMGQQLGAGGANIGNPLAGTIPAANPVLAMMEQMTKAARNLPTAPFTSPVPGAMPFPPNMAAMAGMMGMGDAAAKAAATGQNAAADAQAPEPASTDATAKTAGATAKPAKTTARKTTAAKQAAKGQGKNDQSTETKATPTQKGKPKAGRATTASDAHGSRDDELAQLARRIADLSETIAALEGGTEGSGGKPPKGS
ncbi:hypothetical protein ACQ0MK_20830 [Thalassospira lucentensis]|uniref:hypothetical protein n=1 Tax=Thalassospira lucentensis TaxID=168935 RepID=UPI003D2F22B4